MTFEPRVQRGAKIDVDPAMLVRSPGHRPNFAVMEFVAFLGLFLHREVFRDRVPMILNSQYDTVCFLSRTT